MKKNIVLVFFSLLFSFSIAYLLLFAWVFIFKKHIDQNNFENLDNLNFHRKISDQVHHLRGNNWPYHKRNILNKKEDFLYTIYSKFEKGKDNFLIQGDSWAEFTVYKDKLNQSLKNITKERKIGLINSGISSYSPSTMKVQYQILEKEYDIRPNYLISIIDQTDLGDELCRYKNKIVSKKDGTVDYIKRENNTGATIDFSKYYAFSEILLKEKHFINFRVTNYYLKRSLEELKHKVNNFKKFGFKNRNNYKCKFDQIQKYLFELSSQDKEYFKKRTQEYLNFLISKDYINQIYIVTFPHKYHLDEFYKINVSNIINELSLTSKIIHIDFTRLIENKKYKTKDIYETNDPASHLREEAHIIFFEKIFEEIAKAKM